MNEKDAVLLSEAQADLKKFASKDETRCPLTHIHVTKEYAEATRRKVRGRDFRAFIRKL